MKLLFTTSGAPLSRLIRWGLSEPVSHMVFLWDHNDHNPDQGFVIHSNLIGVHTAFYKQYKKSAKVVYEFNLPTLSIEQENEVWHSLLSIAGQPYDVGAFAYFTWRAFLKKCFGRPMPTNNPWGRHDGWLCNEIYHSLPEWLAPRMPHDLEIISPYGLAERLAALQGRDLNDFKVN